MRTTWTAQPSGYARSAHESLLPPTDQPWKERLCYLEDPDGNPLHITAPIEE